MFFSNGTETPRGNGNAQPFGMLAPSAALSENPSALPGNGHKLYTIQRVNGNGGNGKTDGVGGGHRHTLEDSDRVKKNSVHRYLLKKSKDEKKVLVSGQFSYNSRSPQMHTSKSRQGSIGGAFVVAFLVDECHGCA